MTKRKRVYAYAILIKDICDVPHQLLFHTEQEAWAAFYSGICIGTCLGEEARATVRAKYPSAKFERIPQNGVCSWYDHDDKRGTDLRQVPWNWPAPEFCKVENKKSHRAGSWTCSHGEACGKSEPRGVWKI